MLSRRNFFKTASMGAAVVASTNFSELLAWAEPSRAPQPGGPILLNSNENAYGPFPRVLALGHPFEGFNRYPDHHSDLVSERLGAHNKIAPENVITGCGSTEILRVTAAAFTGPGRKLVTASPTFEAMGHYSEAMNAEVVRVPLAANFAHDLGAMLKAAGSDAGLIYICNPNNPTANLTPRADLEDFIRKLPPKTRVLIDEAYHDFVPAGPDYASFIDHPIGDERVIVSRTFSKVYGLAGMRMGYGIAAKPAVVEMKKYRTADPLNVCVMRCALVSLEDAEAHKIAVERNATDRDEFMRQSAARKIKPIPSATNFVMMDSHRQVQQMIDYFKSKNIEIGRPFPPLNTFVRISLGTPPQMQQFWEAWDAIPKIV